MDDGADLISMVHKECHPTKTGDSYRLCEKGKLSGWDFMDQARKRQPA